LGFWLHNEDTIDEKRGSPTIEFVTTLKAPEQKRPRRVVLRLPWPTYGLKVQRTHTATDFRLKPPFRLRWTFKAKHVLEFPPSIAYGRLYVANQRGRFYAIHHRTGKIVWQRRFNHCSASSPTVAYRVVYHAWMQPLPCNRYPRSQRGMITAMAARTGKLIWTFRAGAFETSPLVIGKTLYAGSWDHKLYAINIYTGRSTSGPTVEASTRSTPAPAGCAGARRRARGSAAASTSTPPPRSPTAGSSSGTATGRSTRSAPRADDSSGRSTPAPTSTPPPRSGSSVSTLAPTTATSWLSTRRRATGSGASPPRRRCTARRA